MYNKYTAYYGVKDSKWSGFYNVFLRRCVVWCNSGFEPHNEGGSANGSIFDVTSTSERGDKRMVETARQVDKEMAINQLDQPVKEGCQNIRVVEVKARGRRW